MDMSKTSFEFYKQRWFKRSILAIFILIDAMFLGFLYQNGILNQLDYILNDSFPNDLIWLLQITQAFVGGFILIRVLFQDFPPSRIRNLGIVFSPIALFLLTILILELLLQGQEIAASITFDIVSLGTNTLIWSATYLSIAIGLTLTYKVQRYGNFAQSEFFMVGMFFGVILTWNDYFFPIVDAPGDGVFTWTLLFVTLFLAFILTGIIGVIVDRAVYRGFRIKDTNPQVMMIASLGIALILRSIYFMRFSSSKLLFRPDADFQHISNRWEIPTTKFRLNLGDRSISEGRTYTEFNCEQSTNSETGELLFDTNGEPIMQRIVTDGSKPPLEIYDVATDCASVLTTNYPYYKGVLPAVVFLSVALLVLLLNKSRLGMKMRAVADDPKLAASSGINVERIHLTSAFLSAGITGLGGAIFSVTLLFNPTTAFSLLLPSFAVIVLGTIGSVQGAIFASILVGFVRAISSPILVGVGYPLGRSGYSAMGAVMPYIFLVAILIIIPKGMGHAWENWKIDRIRRRQEKPSPSPNKKLISALAILPTGIFGIHHLWSGRSDKAQNFSIIVFSSYIFHRFSNFIVKNSFADKSCSGLCRDSESVDSNLQLLTGRKDGTLTLEDSPFYSDIVTSTDENWLEMMSTEIQLMNLLSDFSEIIWPWVPILLWIVAAYEGFNLLSNGTLSNKVNSSKNNFNTISNLWGFLNNLTNNIKSSALHFFTKINNSHASIVKSFRSLISRKYIVARNALFETSNRSSNTDNSILYRINIKNMNQLNQNKYFSPAIRLFEFIISKSTDPYGREGPRGSNIAFFGFLSLILLLVWWLPISVNSDVFNWYKLFQVSNITQSVCIFILMAFSLNLHTGYTGMVNFGVIFFVGVGAITVCVLTAPTEMNGYGWDILPASIVAIFLSAMFGWSLAYPTARLRTDYFAIVTISLGEILRLLLTAEPLLRTGPTASAIGLGSYPLPFKEWWFCGSGVDTGIGLEHISPDSCKSATPELESPALFISEILNLGEPAPYSFLLAIICMSTVILIWYLLETILSSPWGRILKAIREDEEVAQHHGHNVIMHKAASLSLGAAIAALAGVLWAWKLTGVGPSFMSPASTTFLVWAAFIIGGATNNKGMIIGSFVIVLMEFVFNVLVVANSPDAPLYTISNRIDSVFVWLVTDQWQVTKVFLFISLTGLFLRLRAMTEIGVWGVIVFLFTAIMMNSDRALETATNYAGEVTISGGGMVYVKLMLIGMLMLYSLKFNSKGLLPEVPTRPERNFGDDI